MYTVLTNGRAKHTTSLKHNYLKAKVNWMKKVIKFEDLKYNIQTDII